MVEHFGQRLWHNSENAYKKISEKLKMYLLLLRKFIKNELNRLWEVSPQVREIKSVSTDYKVAIS